MYTQPSFKSSVISSGLEHFLSLPFGRRVVLVSSFFSCLFLFFPWFYEGEYWFTAFGKISIFSVFLTLSAVFPLFLVFRELFAKKGYCWGMQHQSLLLVFLGMGIYTLFLYTFSLYELLNYNPRTSIGVGGMLEFISLGVSLGGVILSHGFFPKPKRLNAMDNPEKIDTSKASLEIEPQPLFPKDSEK